MSVDIVKKIISTERIIDKIMNLSEIAKQLGSAGGKKSAQSRFKGKTKKEISEIMKKVRLAKPFTKEQNKESNKRANEVLTNLNQNVQNRSKH